MGRQASRQEDTQLGMKTGRHTIRQAGRQFSRQTGRQSDKLVGRQADGQTDSQAGWWAREIGLVTLSDRRTQITMVDTIVYGDTILCFSFLFISSLVLGLGE